MKWYRYIWRWQYTQKGTTDFPNDLIGHLVTVTGRVCAQSFDAATDQVSYAVTSVGLDPSGKGDLVMLELTEEEEEE